MEQKYPKTYTLDGDTLFNLALIVARSITDCKKCEFRMGCSKDNIKKKHKDNNLMDCCFHIFSYLSKRLGG